MNQAFLLYTLITSIFLLAGGLVIVIKYLLNTLKENDMYKKDMVRHTHEASEHARKKAEALIDAANEKAKEIIAGAETFSSEVSASNKELQKTQLEKATNELVEQYRSKLEELYQNNINLFKNISKDIEDKASAEISDFKNVLEKETIESQKIVGEKLEREYDDVQKEIETYKNQELARAKENIRTIIEKVVKLSIGRSLNQQIQEELVLEALEEATRTKHE